MAGTSEIRVPRWLVITSYPVGAICLTAFFIFLGFPYDLLAGRLSHYVESAMNVRVHIGDLSPHLGLGGPGLAASEVLAAREGEQTIVLQEVVVRPAWSLAWLRGTPAIHIDVTSEIGNGAGTLTVGQMGGWDGSLESVQLAYLPLAMLDVVEIDGILDATVDVHGASAEEGGSLVGTVNFELRDGTLGSDALPVAVPFDRLHGTLRFGDEPYLTVEKVELEGPLIEATIQGQVGHAKDLGGRPLAIEVAYRVRDRNLARIFGSVGPPGDDGRAHLSISGTLSKPAIR